MLQFARQKLEDRYESAANFRLEEAMRLYTRWGSQKKVEMLQNCYRDLLPGPPQVVVTESVQLALNDASEADNVEVL